MQVNFKFQNGEQVRDVVTGFTGIVECSSVWLNGCKRYAVQPAMTKGDSKRPESVYMDEQQLISVSRGVIDNVTPQNNGGPSSTVSKKERGY
jgi:hypothetical protein